MPSSHSSSSDGYSSGSDDSAKWSAVPNFLLQFLDAYATDPESIADGVPEKQFDDEDGQSVGSEFHTPAHSSKCRHLLPSVSPKKRVKFLLLNRILMPARFQCNSEFRRARIRNDTHSGTACIIPGLMRIMRRRAYFQESSRSYDFIHISGAGCQGGGGAARGPRVRKVPAPGPPRPPAPARGPATAVQGAQTPMWSPFVKVWCRSLALAFAPSPPLLSLRSTFAPSQPFNNCTIIPSRTISCPHTFLMPSRAMQTPPTMSRRRTRK
mmetsp:Transcript_41118/g.85848  ORF Transcript_41118/g.85848 Transcript_41118/m.85848 type:complete len:267 (-) Transcript_41118:697-1497(-)